MTTNDARCTQETKSTIVMAKAALHKKKGFFTPEKWIKFKAEIKCNV
jgi:hypothetical protein